MFFFSEHSSSSNEHSAINMDQENQPFLVEQKRQVLDYNVNVWFLSNLIVNTSRDSLSFSTLHGISSKLKDVIGIAYQKLLVSQEINFKYCNQYKI